MEEVDSLMSLEKLLQQNKGVINYVQVYGLPRSGTSMMMQMLAAGGLPVMSDGQREADDDNPKGYFEIDEAKQLATNNAWVANAQGRVIKVVAQLLPYLPKKFKYRIIFMDRAVEEVLASQKTMLSRNDQSGGDIPEDRLRDIYARQVRASADLLKRNRIPTYRMVYGNVVADPAAAAEKLNQFFDGRLDVEKMAQAVDPSLHRQKTSELKNVATD